MRFDQTMATDENEAVLINEALARELQWDEAVGKTIAMGQQERRSSE